MENTNLAVKRGGILICGLAYIFLMAQSLSVILASPPQLPDDFKVRDYFSFFGSGGIDWQALHDPSNNPILVACIKGITEESFEALGIADLQQRLEKLERGNLIKKTNGRYILAFPAIIGDERQELRGYAEQASGQLVPLAEKIIAEIRPLLAGRDEMLYHVLWSIIMDGGPAWDAARAEMHKKIDSGDTSIQNKAWLLYPSHPYRAGTNSGSNSFGHLKVTWSRNTPSPNNISRVVVRHASQLTQAIEQNIAITSMESKDALGKYGLIDEEGKVRLYYIQADSEAARSYAELGTQFGRHMMTHLDVKKVAEMLDVSPGVAFVIAYHEICWQLLQELAEKKILSVPQIVAQAGTKISDVYQLVSLTLVKRIKDPLLEKEMSAEESQAIEEFRRIKARIIGGESFENNSTPLHAVLTHLSALGPGQTRDYFMGLDILRAPTPPEKPGKGSLWPVYAGDKELEDTFIMVYSKGQWFWIGNMGGNYDWHLTESTFEKWAKKKIEEITKTVGSNAKSETEIIEYFEKTKNEILQGRKFSNQSTPADAFLTLISAYHHQDKDALEQIFPIVKQKQYEKLLSQEVGAQMLAVVRKAVLCRIEIENEPPKESDLCAIYSSQSPDKTIDQIWSFAYVEGVWRFANATGDMHNWRAQAEQAESLTRNILQSDAEKTKAPATNSLQQKADTVEGKWLGILPEFNQKYVMRFWIKPDGSLAGAATRKNPDDRPFDAVTFENGKLRFEEKTNQGIFEGTMKEDGLIIEGKWQKPGVLTPCILKRADDAEIENKGRDGGEKEQDAPKSDESAGNRVLSLDGEGDYVLIADSQSLRSFSNAITIEVWFKVSSFYPENGMVNSIIRKNITAGSENFFLRFRNVAGGPSVEMSIGYDNEVLKAPYNYAVDTWYHLAGTYDGSAVTVFVNDLSIKSEIASGTLYIDESDLSIGKGDPEFSSGEYFHGALDEIRIWNIARTQEEIQAAMNSPLTGNEEGLVVYLNFDDGTAKDLSGHGNDGLLNADAQIVESPFPVSLPSEGEKSGKLVAWWKFENDVNDAAGDNHGTINGNPTYVDGKVGQAISLDGDDYINFGNPDSLNFSTDDWTISAWIKTTQTGVNQQDDALLNRGTVFANGGDEAGGIRYALAVNEGQLGSITLTTDNDMSKVQAISRTAVNDGAWHHIVGMRTAGQLYLYVDGVLDGGNYLSAGYDLSGTSQHNAYIGSITDNRDDSLYKYFVGLIDEVCIIRGAIDANGVRELYSGENPLKVAQASVIEPKSRSRQLKGAGTRGGVEGDWRIISDQISQQAIIEIRKKADGTFAAAVVAEDPDEASQAILLEEVTFKNGRLHFEAPTEQTVFDGTMKEDGSTIQGSFQQQGQAIAVVLKRIVAAPSEMATVAQEQLQDMKGGTSNIATALILILVLAGLIGGIVFFLVKSSIRK